MDNLEETFRHNQQTFLTFVADIQAKRMSEVAIRKAIKKYEVRNSKIDNVTPLRAKKIYSSLLTKYSGSGNNGKNWLQNERRLFIWCMICYLYKTGKQINELSDDDYKLFLEIFPGKDLNLLKFQTFSLIKKNNKVSGWTKEEDEILAKVVLKNQDQNKQWSQISKQFFEASTELYFRNAKQCRERWLNHLDPNKIKGKWTPEQDKILLKWVLEKGKKWSQIVPELEGKKNEHMIKNRYKSLLHKKQKEGNFKNLKQNDMVSLILKDVERMEKEDEMDEEVNEEVNEESEPEEEVIEKKEDENKRTLRKRTNTRKRQIKCQQKRHTDKNDSLSEEFSHKKTNCLIVQPKCQVEKPSKEFNRKQEEIELDKIQLEDIAQEVEDQSKKGEKQFYEKLFHSANTPIADSCFPPSIILDARSPANYLVSPFGSGNVWTPTIFLLDDSQRQVSPQVNFGNNFGSKFKSDFHKFVGEGDQKKQ